MKTTTLLKKLLTFIVPFILLPLLLIIIFIYLYFTNITQKDITKLSINKVMQWSYIIQDIHSKHTKNDSNIRDEERQLILDNVKKNYMPIIVIVDTNMKILNHINKVNIGGIFSLNDNILRDKIDMIIKKNNLNIFNYIDKKLMIKPLVYDKDKISSFIIYDYGYEINQKVTSYNQAFLYLFFISLFIAIISIIVIIIFSLNITTPLNLLLDGAKRITNGDFVNKIEILSDDELAELSNQFNKMADQLQSTIHALQENNKNFQYLLDTTMEAIIISDENNKIIHSNQVGVKLFKGKNISSFLGMNIIEFVPDYELSKLQKALQKEYDEPRNYDLIKNDGTIFPALASGRNMIMDDKKVRISIVLDLTKIKQQDQQLLQQSRLAQMGEMISMIAHQWRQPLNAISLTSNNLQFKLLMDDVDKELFKKEITLIDEYSQHLSKTIDDFRGFFKEDKTKEITTLQEIVNGTLDIVRISVENKNIKIITDFNCKKKFETYPNEIKQVVLNLIKNAEDILLDNDIQNPTIFIETKCIDNDKILIIRDNGGGIPENIIDKIFDPYFSTKKEKDGTGLGLYMSKTIIEEHCGGKLSVSNDNNGAIFMIRLDNTKKDDNET